MASIDQTEMITNEGDAEMERVLAEMLEADETITARADGEKASSDQARVFGDPQPGSGRNCWPGTLNGRRSAGDGSSGHPDVPRDQLAAQLAQKDSRIAELERQVEALRVSHLAMIRTVGEMGGISKLLETVRRLTAKSGVSWIGWVCFRNLR